MTDWTISNCGPADLGEIADLVNAAYRGQGGATGWTSEVGMVDGQRTTSAKGRAAGAQAARITVLSVRESLIAWYERQGYRRTDDTERFPYDDGRFGAPLRPDLVFIVLEKPFSEHTRT